MKVVVGMSGGVDSSVTAYLLREQGYEVEGVSFILEERRLNPQGSQSSCCSIESVLDARKTADIIGIKHSMINLKEEFTSSVVRPFINAYSEGLTPNPCILCNEHIKFRFLLKTAEEQKADFISTGHYARIIDGKLLQGLDPKKDQSYVLYVLKQEELRRLKLPLGEITKDEVRRIALEMGLPSAKRPESQEICFVGEGNYSGYMEPLIKQKEGAIIEFETNRVLGAHKGIHLYTIGQRKRLGIATGRPLYVIRIDPQTNNIYVGQKESAMKKEFIVKDINWLMAHDRAFRATVKIRSMMKAEPAAIDSTGDDQWRVFYDRPQWAPAPGQSAVFYEGDTVIGGGIINRLLD